MAEPAHPPIRSFGRIKSRAIKPRQGALMETLLPRLAIDLAASAPGRRRDLAGDRVRRGRAFGPAGRAPCRRALPGGRALLERSRLGAAPHRRARAGERAPCLWGTPATCWPPCPKASISRLFLMFPDPWPKARHRKRRLLQAETAAEFARVLKPGAPFRFATDWGDYADRGLETVLQSGALRLAGGAGGRLAQASARPRHHPLRGEATGRCGSRVPGLRAALTAD